MNVYLVTNLINGKQYVGAEKGNNSDYFGSGKLIKEALEVFGIENFKKEIIIDNKYIDSWKECLELESACILSLNILNPNGYNITWWNWPIPVEMCREGGKRTHELHLEEQKEWGRKAGKRLHELHPEEQKEWGRIGGKKTKELKIGIFASGMAGKGGARTHELHLEEQKEWGRIGGKISGRENKELKRGFFVSGMASKGGKKMIEKLKEQGKFLEHQSKAGKIGGKMSAYILFEIDGLIQQTTLGTLLKI